MIGQELSGKVAVVTGAGRGQGLCEAQLLAEAGATVILGDVDEEAGRKAEQAVPGSRFVRLDVSSEGDWKEAARIVAEEFGGIDILVNNAGVLRYGTIAETPLCEIHAVQAVNLDGPYLGMQTMLPLFRNGGGSIINISSISALMGRPSQIAYLLSKWGLRGLSRAAALEFASLRVRVNAIFPGLVATDMSEGRYGADGVAAMGGNLPVGRAGVPADIGALVVYLASDRSGFINGAEFVCDGGFTAGMR